MIRTDSGLVVHMEAVSEHCNLALLPEEASVPDTVAVVVLVVVPHTDFVEVGPSAPPVAMVDIDSSGCPDEDMVGYLLDQEARIHVDIHHNFVEDIAAAAVVPVAFAADLDAPRRKGTSNIRFAVAVAVDSVNHLRQTMFSRYSPSMPLLC